MGSVAILTAIAAAAAVAGVAMLRLAWAQPRRSAWRSGLGWALLLLAIWSGARADGAWGISIAALFAMGAALALLAHAALSAPSGTARASTRRAHALPEPGEAAHVGRRIVTFLLVGGAAMAVSVALSVALRGMCMAIGIGEADSNATAMFAPPITWGLLAYLILMQKRRRGQLLVLLAGIVPALPALAGMFA